MSVCDGLLDATPAELHCTVVAGDALPEPARHLLNHREHMTATLNAYYHAIIRLEVLREASQDHYYSRVIRLIEPRTRRVVEFGIARLDLNTTTPNVRDAILERQTPLGDILTQYDVYRRVEPRWFYRFGPDSAILPHFHMDLPDGTSTVAQPPHQNEAWGRVGVIHVNHQPAIRLLEVVTGLK